MLWTKYIRTVLIQIYLPASFKLIPLIVSVLCTGQTILNFSETTGPTKAKNQVALPWDRGKDGKLIQTIEVICCHALLSTPGGGGH